MLDSSCSSTSAFSLEDVFVGPTRLARKASQITLLLAVISRYLAMATVGQKVSNCGEYGILLAAEQVVRAGVLSHAPGCESVTRFTCLTFHGLVYNGRFFVCCWLLGRLLVVAFSLDQDQSVRSSYQPMTSLAYFHDCHSCYDERSIVQKKNVLFLFGFLLVFFVFVEDI